MITITQMTLDHYQSAPALWHLSEGIGLSEADSPAGIARFLERNSGLSFVATDEQRLVGVVLCGHDGRRGYIHHLAVAAAYRQHGIGRTLVRRSLTALKQTGIDKCHLFVFKENQAALQFWQRIGWTERVELTMLSRATPAAVLDQPTQPTTN